MHTKTIADKDSGVAPGAAPERVAQRSWFGRSTRRLFVVYFVLVHIVVFVVLWQPGIVSRIEKFVRKTPASQPEYRGMMTAHSVVLQSMPKESTVYLGDSRLRDMDVTSISEGPVYNLSIGGDTTRGLQTRLKHYQHLDRCRLVVVGVGVNDLSHFSDEESLQAYEWILCYMKDVGVRSVVVCSVLPVDEATYQQANSAWIRGHRTTNARIATYNEGLRSLCSRFTFVSFVDSTADVADESGNLRQGFSTDGLHLSESGNRAWAASLERSIKRLPKS